MSRYGTIEFFFLAFLVVASRECYGVGFVWRLSLLAREGPLRLCVLECWSITAMSEENVVLEHLETPEKQGRFVKERGGASHRLGRWRL